MKLIFYSHPNFLGHQSMPRFTQMLAKGMAKRGHDVEIWYPSAVFAGLSKKATLKKYLGYIDQLLIFPLQAKKKIRKKDEGLHVLTDHALGPWMNFLKDRKHVVHCHDFIAQKAAKDGIEGFKVGRLGKVYQAIIKNGFTKARNFIAVSETTRKDLHKIVPIENSATKVVYNGLNQDFNPTNSVNEIRYYLSKLLNQNLSEGFIFHIGNNEWYKNRVGVIKLYDYWRTNYDHNLPLVMVGPKPTEEQSFLTEKSFFSNDILFFNDVEDKLVKQLYAAATFLLFPSYTEGFGWPIAEAMASGCPVITTGEAPMTEVGAEAAFYIPKRSTKDQNRWFDLGAKTIEKVISLSSEDRKEIISKGIENAKRFDSEIALDSIEVLYQSYYLENHENTSHC
ncbi:glycosyltransferase family 4 protein [Zunongwangia sp. HGR-M22]|uniref:glycosyltransferase family 4 protein n=1 Tax=Zunongwangia sp. HGR-M22 TaxID=3015168 RepID=UPI0022DD55C0|nr:glycosyltransferase family 1 protein [Zunongwangia sp. HGR-M22]WBL26398.1 glycosyltransferase family 1 protein [Zunongwangia sp. HGR-M22]